MKQDIPSHEDGVSQWVDEVWNGSFGATTQAILKTKPFAFSAASLSDIDIDALRGHAVGIVSSAREREGFELNSEEGRQRALAVLFGYLNQAQQAAMKIEFYVWNTQHDARVRGEHVERDGKIFRWDDPPEGGHPSQDFGCRFYARALGVAGYWARVSEGVDNFTSDLANWEGNVEHMHRDTRGFVTVGKGKMLPSASDAVALTLVRQGTDALASEDEIRSEYNLIAEMVEDVGRNADYFGPFTNLYLSQPDVDRW